MLRFGNREKLPLELEIGLLDIAQFGGKRYVKNADGSIKLLNKYPAGLKSFFKALSACSGEYVAECGGKP